MSVTQRTSSRSPPRPGMPISSPSDKIVVSTCLFNASASKSAPSSENSLPISSVNPSQRILHTNFFDRSTINGHETRETGQGSRFRNDLKTLKQYDVTTEEQFDAIPVNARRKYLATLERLKFAQSSRAAALDNSHPQNYSQQDSHPPKSYHGSIHHGALYYVQNRSRLNSYPQQTSSLAERRGKRLDHLKSEGMHLSEQSNEDSGQKSTCSLLSCKSSHFEKVNVKSLSQDQQLKVASQYRRSILLDTAGKVFKKESPIRQNHSLFSKVIRPPLSDTSIPSSKLGSVTDTTIQSEPKSANWTDTIVSDTYDLLDSVEDEKNLCLDLSLDNYHTNLSVTSPTSNRQTKPSFRRKISRNHPMSGNMLIHSPQSLNFEYLHTSNLKPRSRSQSLASSIKTTNTYTSTSKNKDFGSKESMNSSKSGHVQIYNSHCLNTLSSKSVTTPKSIPIVISSQFENQKSIAASYSATNPLPQSAGIISRGIGQKLNHIDDRNNDTRHIRSRRSYTISSTKFTSHSLVSSHSGANGQPFVLKKIDSPLSSGNNQMTLGMILTHPEGKGPFGGPDGWGLDDKENSLVKRFWNKVTQNLKSPVA